MDEGVEYAVRCPKCEAQAVAWMIAVGIKGTYREPMVKWGAARIVCGRRGFSRDVPVEESDAYELWYVTEFDGHRLWAENRERLDLLIEWLSGDGRIRKRSLFERAYLEALPKWLRTRRDRARILERPERMREAGVPFCSGKLAISALERPGSKARPVRWSHPPRCAMPPLPTSPPWLLLLYYSSPRQAAPIPRGATGPSTPASTSRAATLSFAPSWGGIPRRGARRRMIFMI